MTKHCVFTHHDLDGVVSFIVLKWFYPDTDFEVITIRNVFEFRENFLNWQLNHNPNDYEQIFILDLDVSGNEDLIDRDNFFIVDHHETHKKSKYKHANAFVKKYSSASKLLYKILKIKFPNINITNNQKFLICLADDYDSYTLKSPLSKLLNTLFWNLNDNFNSFYTQFKEGIKGFTPEQVSIIKIYAFEYKKYRNNIKEIFTGVLQHNNKQYSVCSFFADKYINDLSDHFFDKECTDVIIMFNPSSKKLYVRRNRKTMPDIHIGSLCESWGGGGHEGAGGAPLTDHFISLSKTLKRKHL